MKSLLNQIFQVQTIVICACDGHEIWNLWREPQISQGRIVSELYRGHLPRCYLIKICTRDTWYKQIALVECGEVSSKRHMLKKQHVEEMGKAGFSAWATRTEVKFRESQLFLLPQVYWVSPSTAGPKQIASDGAACSEEMPGQLSRVHISQRKNKPG